MTDQAKPQIIYARDKFRQPKPERTDLGQSINIPEYLLRPISSPRASLRKPQYRGHQFPIRV